jgi:bifunctional DNA-binding transcriptional regulator/antitoxin component of YhaV-PrlF toxin-antitoxin module
MTIFPTVTAKGQVTLRKELLAHLGVRPGQRLDVMDRVVKITTDTTALVRALVRDDLDLASRAMEVLEQAELDAIPVSEPPQNPHGEVCETCISDSVFSVLKCLCFAHR